MSNPRAGAMVCFEGWVRGHHQKKKVVALEYECFEKLAVKEGRKIIMEAREQFGILEARCVHRVGRLKVGETAVWIGVVAEHRHAAFRACEYIISQVKIRVPIWKKECYSTGDSGWVEQ